MQMRALGIYSRLDQVFDAPVAVKEVLIGQFGLEYSVTLLRYEFTLFSFKDLVYGCIFGNKLIKVRISNKYLYFDQYIGSKETDQRADEIQRLGILDFWTPENHYRWSKSRYGGHISALVEPVAHSQLLLCSMFL